MTIFKLLISIVAIPVFILTSGCTAQQVGEVPEDQAQFRYQVDHDLPGRTHVEVRMMPAFSDDLELIYAKNNDSAPATLAELRTMQGSWNTTLLFKARRFIQFANSDNGDTINSTDGNMGENRSFMKLHPGVLYNRALHEISINDFAQAMAEYRCIKAGPCAQGGGWFPRLDVPIFVLRATCLLNSWEQAGTTHYSCARVDTVRLEARTMIHNAPRGEGLVLDWVEENT